MRAVRGVADVPGGHGERAGAGRALAGVGAVVVEDVVAVGQHAAAQHRRAGDPRTGRAGEVRRDGSRHGQRDGPVGCRCRGGARWGDLDDTPVEGGHVQVLARPARSGAELHRARVLQRTGDQACLAGLGVEAEQLTGAVRGQVEDPVGVDGEVVQALGRVRAAGVAELGDLGDVGRVVEADREDARVGVEGRGGVEDLAGRVDREAVGVLQRRPLRVGVGGVVGGDLGDERGRADVARGVGVAVVVEDEAVGHRQAVGVGRALAGGQVDAFDRAVGVAGRAVGGGVAGVGEQHPVAYAEATRCRHVGGDGGLDRAVRQQPLDGVAGRGRQQHPAGAVGFEVLEAAEPFGDDPRRPARARIVGLRRLGGCGHADQRDDEEDDRKDRATAAHRRRLSRVARAAPPPHQPPACPPSTAATDPTRRARPPAGRRLVTAELRCPYRCGQGRTICRAIAGTRTVHHPSTGA